MTTFVIPHDTPFEPFIKKIRLNVVFGDDKEIAMDMKSKSKDDFITINGDLISVRDMTRTMDLIMNWLAMEMACMQTPEKAKKKIEGYGIKILDSLD